MDEFSLIPSKTEWDRIPTDPGPSKLRDRAMIDTLVFSGSVKRGSDRCRFLGLMESSVDFGMVILSAPVAVQSCNMPRWGGVAQLHEPQCDHHPLRGAMELYNKSCFFATAVAGEAKEEREGLAWPGTRFGRAVFSSNKGSFYKMVKKKCWALRPSQHPRFFRPTPGIFTGCQCMPFRNILENSRCDR